MHSLNILKKIYHKNLRKNNWPLLLRREKYIFVDRKKDSPFLLLVLCGYKPVLYDIVFKRLKMFLPYTYDVCLCTSGKINDDIIRKIASANDWSYLGIDNNNVALIQNVAIDFHKNAEYIFKMDEDIFVTKGVFGGLVSFYNSILSEGKIIPGFVAPTIPLNAFCYSYVLDRFELTSKYKKLFGNPIQEYKEDTQIVSNPKSALFMWGGFNSSIKNIDYIAKTIIKDEPKATPIYSRFNIGFIMFERKIWEEFGKMPVNRKDKKWHGLGTDEEYICTWGLSHSRPLVVSNNYIVGHFSFSGQFAEMKKFYEYHKNCFDIDEKITDAI